MFGKLFPSSSSSASHRSSVPAIGSTDSNQQQQDGLLTPKASAQPTPNPFDSFQVTGPSPSSTAAVTPQRTASQLSLATLASAGASGSRTPRSANATPGGSMSYHDGIHPRSSFFGPVTPGNVTPGGAAPVTPGGLPTTCKYNWHRRARALRDHSVDYCVLRGRGEEPEAILTSRRQKRWTMHSPNSGKLPSVRVPSPKFRRTRSKLR
jgi:hypothetical protein